MKCRDEIQADQRHEHTGDTAPRALKSRDELKEAGDSDIRERHEDIISNSQNQKNDVAADDLAKSFFHVGSVSFQIFVDGVLNQRECDDLKAESFQHEINDAAVGILSVVDLIDLLTHLIRPDIAVNAAGDQSENEGETAGDVVFSVGEGVDLVSQNDKPINVVDTAGDDRENDGSHNVSGLDFLGCCHRIGCRGRAVFQSRSAVDTVCRVGRNRISAISAESLTVAGEGAALRTNIRVVIQLFAAIFAIHNIPP